MFPTRNHFTVRLANGGMLRLGERPLVMGVLNVTPDSFAEGASRLDLAAAIEAALKIEADGADLIDVGGESTRPGAPPLPEREELARVQPLLRGIAGRLHIPISIDTYKAGVARVALDEGASIINDVSGLRREPHLAKVAADRGAALVLMHSRGTPETMADSAIYTDMVGEVVAELKASIAAASAGGVAAGQVIVDPGIGFAKRPEHSYGVLAQLSEIASSLGRPVLAGPSRKSFMRSALGERRAVERDWGTAAAVTAAVLGGAHIVRVHAVSEMVQVVNVAEEIRRAGRLIANC